MNKYSSRITQPRSQGASQAMLYGTGLTDADLQKAQVGICSMWWEGNTCNMHLDRLAAHGRRGGRPRLLRGARRGAGVGERAGVPEQDLADDVVEVGGVARLGALAVRARRSGDDR